MFIWQYRNILYELLFIKCVILGLKETRQRLLYSITVYLVLDKFNKVVNTFTVYSFKKYGINVNLVFDQDRQHSNAICISYRLINK